MYRQELNGNPSLLRSASVRFVGEMGRELHIPADSCVAVYRAIMEAGKPLGLVNAGYRAIDSLSIEKGYPHWHQEIRMDDNPMEAGLMFTCKLKSATQFQGREALENLKSKGPVAKKKVCLTLDDNQACLIGMEIILRDEQVVGYVRRADYGFYVDQPIAYGYISNPEGKLTNDWLKKGTYQIESMGRRFTAKIHLRSPFDSGHSRLQGDYSNIEEPEIVATFLKDYHKALEGSESEKFH
jgi:sarcosine dehydrogenase